jgi:ribosome-associated protein
MGFDHITAEYLKSELAFVTSRSSGPGGQNVNKVNSKVTLYFDIANSRLLTDEQKEIHRERLSTRITQSGVLMLPVQGFVKRKARKPTKPPKGAKLQRLKSKKEVSEKKKWRRRPDLS